MQKLHKEQSSISTSYFNYNRALATPSSWGEMKSIPVGLMACLKLTFPMLDLTASVSLTPLQSEIENIIIFVLNSVIQHILSTSEWRFFKIYPIAYTLFWHLGC